MMQNNNFGSMSRRTAVLVLQLVLVAGLFVAGRTALGEINPVSEKSDLVIVNGEQITGHDLDRQLIKTHRRLSPENAGSFDYQQLLTKLVNDRLIIQEAKAMGMDTEEGFADFLDGALNRLAVGALIKSSYNPDLTVEQDEVLKLFHEYYWKIQIRTLSCATNEQALELRSSILAGASMDSLARILSLDSRKYRGGLDKLKFWRDLPFVWQNGVRDLAIGELSAPLPYQDAWAIVRTEARQDSDTANLSGSERDIRLYVRNLKKDSAWAGFLDSLSEFCEVSPDSVVLLSIKQDADNLYNSDFMNGSTKIALSVSDGATVSEDELRREVSYAAMKAGNLSFERLLKKSLDRLTEDMILKCGAIRGGFAQNDRILTRLESLRDSALIEAYCQEMIVPQILFNRQEFDEYYEEHLDEFRLSDEVQLNDMQIVDHANAASAAARLGAGADFGFVSRQFARSDPTDSDPMEWMAIDKYPTEVAAIISELKTGESTEPIALAEGWVIFELKARRPGLIRTMDKVQLKIREVMFQRKFEEILDSQLIILKNGSDIVYFDENIANYFGNEPAEQRPETTE